MLARLCVDLRKVGKEHKLNSNYLYRKCTRLQRKSAKVEIDIGSYKFVVIQRSSSNVANPNKVKIVLFACFVKLNVEGELLYNDKKMHTSNSCML